jgi:thiol-disulfide isomerase/thioredoxin
MPQINETIYAPSFDGSEWIQQGPIDLKDLRGKAVVLVDFWDYTCVNCIRTLPYVAGWHRRYARDGLQIVGVHAPEFSFARDHVNVVAAIKQFGLEYPVVVDNGYNIWRAYSNRFWPAKYLVDAEGRLRYYHFGEGLYQETETEIQRLLGELNPALNFRPPIEPLRDTDRPGALCYRVTPELYLGFARGQFGNPAGVTRDQAADYADPGRHAEGATYLSGRWRVGQESSCAEAPGAAIVIRYTAMDVNLVLAPPAGKPARLEISLSDSQRAGEDVQFAEGRAMVTIDRARMYSLVANESVVTGSLKITALDPRISAYAFTFISCVVS